MVVVEVRSWLRRRRKDDEEAGGRQEAGRRQAGARQEATDIKSNNPHLAGGEQKIDRYSLPTTAPATRRQPRPRRRPRAPQLLQEALCPVPATRKAAAAPAATTRAAAPPGGSVYCACHAKSECE